MGLPCLLTEAALQEAGTTHQELCPPVWCVHLFKGHGGSYSLHDYFCVFIFFLSWVVGELPGEKSRYDAIRKNQREE